MDFFIDTADVDDIRKAHAMGLVDGVDIRQIAPSDLRENLGISTQDVWLMSTSIEENISLGAGDSTAEQCDLMRGSLFQNTAETSDAFAETALDEGFLGFDQDSFCLFIGRRVFCKI